MKVDGKKVNITLVIPTIRENNFKDFINRWSEIGLFDHVDLMVMEDNPTKTFKIQNSSSNGLPCRLSHLAWDDISDSLGDDEWIIPRRSDTVRSFAYYKAAEDLGEHTADYILTLDDDCYPCDEADGLKYDGEGFLREHLKQLTSRSRWYNTLNSVKPRGIPFYNLGSANKVIVNHGLWTKVLDYDAPYQLANPIEEQFSYDNHVVPAGLYFPMCGMNVMWKREATVLMYHLLMGRRKPAVDKGMTGLDKDGLIKLQLDRFGDIWCGIIMKKIADITDHMVTTGMPYIRHERASNPFVNLKKEADGIQINETFWEYVDKFSYPRGLAEVAVDDSSVVFKTMYREMGRHIEKFDTLPEYADYFRSLGIAMQVWADLF